MMIVRADTDDVLPLPFKLGYFVVRRGVTSTVSSDMPYRGVQRLPFLEDYEGANAARNDESAPVWQAWDRYFTAVETMVLNSDQRVALQVRDALSEPRSYPFCVLGVWAFPSAND